jgi:CO/xanthine dehydrogenase FAD-binding subunit
MRSHLPEFPVACPSSLDEALAVLAEKADRPGGVTPLAGATDLFVPFNAGHLAPTTFVSLSGVAELARPARWDGTTYRMSALTTYTESRRDPRVARELPLLVAAARELGALQIQNRGTWAGNIANASPAADGVPVLLAYDAQLELASVRGRRTVALADYFTGYKKTVRAADELIVGIAVGVPAAGEVPVRQFFRKVGTRRLQAISKVVAAGVIERDAAGRVTRARLALGSVAPITVRARAVEAAITGRTLDAGAADAAALAVRDDIAPIDDVRSTREYRARIAERLVRAFVAPDPGA